MAIPNPLVMTEEIREKAYEAFKYCNNNNFPTNSDYITEEVYFECLDVEMVQRLKDECGYVSSLIIAQMTELTNYRQLERITNMIYQFNSSIRDEHAIVPLSLLGTFLYDSEMFDQLFEENKKIVEIGGTFRSTLNVDESMIQIMYGSSHAEMTKKVQGFVKTLTKKNKWRNTTRFTLDEILNLRDQFFKSLNRKNELELNKKRNRTIAQYTQKGGAGKSHVTVSLAGALALTSATNKRVLVVDLDYQQSATSVLTQRHPSGLMDYKQSVCVYDLLTHFAGLEPNIEALTEFKAKCKSAVVPSQIPNVDLLPSSNDSRFDSEYSVGLGHKKNSIKPNALKVILENICDGNDYDYILIDTRPDIHASAILAYAACDEQIEILKPTGTDLQSFKNFSRRMAIEVFPMLVLSDNKIIKPSTHKLIFNQFITQSVVQEQIVTLLRNALGGNQSQFTVQDVIIPNSSATAACSAQDSTVWNPAKNLDAREDHKPIKAQRRVFTQMAHKLEFELLNSTQV